MKAFVLSIALVLLIGAAPHARPGDLPRLGSSADIILSPHQAHMIGASMLRHLRAEGRVLDDPLLYAWINDLGYRLLAHTDFPKDMRFTFFVVNSDVINAFAAPGGYIAVHSGLIKATRNESDLAAVLAHEIAHVTQHHIQRAIEDQRKMTPLMGLAMLGAVLAAQSGGSGDAPAAIITGAMGAISQRQINFTRKDEAEADRIGIQTLARAGFDVDSMAGFFNRMEQLLRPGSGGVEIPDLLRSHPVNTQRIAEARARARALRKEYSDETDAIGSKLSWNDSLAPIPYVHAGESIEDASEPDNSTSKLNYRLMRERARVLSADSRATVLEYYAGNLARKDNFDSIARHYGYALALIRNNQAGKAITQLQPLLDKHGNNTTLQLAMASARLHAGQRDKALAMYASLHAQMPQSHAVAESYADALLDSGKSADAARAADLLRPLLNENVTEPTLYRTFGRACDISGQKIRAGEAFADATFLSGRASDALEQLKRLLKNKDINYYQRARIEARIEAITPIVLELQRRGITPERQGFG